MRALIMVLPVLGLAQLPDPPLAPWASNHHPTDAPKRHIEQIAAPRHAYTVRQGGTMDGTNCRSPLGVGMMGGPALQQTWESNRAVRLENVGETDVVNPWLSNGRNGFRTLDEIVSSAVAPGMTDREKAFALWFQEIRHRYHWAGDNAELGDPVKVFNVYGHNTCGNDSICLAGLWRRAGLKVTPARVVGHCVSQAFFDGRWNLFDGDMHSMYLLRDNRTVACEQDLVRDHDLIKRSHTQGILNPDKRATDEWQASIYVYEGKPEGDRNSVTGTSMNMVLRPGEAITWRWGHAEPVKYHGDNKPRYPDLICNGLWEYRPDFSGDFWKKGTAAIEGIQANRGELRAAEGKAGAVVWIVRSPYVLVGGRLEVEGSGAKFSLSWDGKSWMEAGPDLGKFFPSKGPARYEYRLRCELGADAHLKRLGIVHDLQMAPLALPAMSVGENKFVYTDQSPGGRKVRITHHWVERSASRPPEPPPAPAFPPDGGEAEGTDLVFRWLPARVPDGDRIADYHFELSERPDMKWPLSTNFYKLISNTPDRGKNQYTLPQVGLLASDQKYYWRVRAKDEKGVWGLWSSTWSFTSRGPSSPIDVTLAFDPDRSVGILRWKPNPVGRKPAKYRIYGSDEKGFSVSDEPYKVVVGASKQVPAMRPANFVTAVSATETAVIGADVKLPCANRAFYRVVAVDEQGKRSGPSEVAEAPRPILYSSPVTDAKVGSEYRYALSAIRSLGDVRTRVVDGKETMNYWDLEAPRFALQQGPPWLKMDASTGLLSGVPDRPGPVAIVVTATIDREVRSLDPRLLSWGLEKIVSTGTQRVGVATQKFTIAVAP
ncbi:MAG TPA: Ig domain-containing protein [Gemmataceae bacterium]|nr:Ig domain-containing protein [Gemmataceae bacterium]